MASGGVAEVSADNEYKVTWDMLDRAVMDETKLLILCTPNNLTGHVVDEEEARVIAGFLKGAGVYCLTDESYERLTYGQKAFSIGSLPKAIRKTNICGSLSPRQRTICLPPRPESKKR